MNASIVAKIKTIASPTIEKHDDGRVKIKWVFVRYTVISLRFIPACVLNEIQFSQGSLTQHTSESVRYFSDKRPQSRNRKIAQIIP